MTPTIPIGPIRPVSGPLAKTGGAAISQLAASSAPHLQMRQFAQDLQSLQNQIRGILTILDQDVNIPVFIAGANHQAGVIPDQGASTTGSALLYFRADGTFADPVGNGFVVTAKSNIAAGSPPDTAIQGLQVWYDAQTVLLSMGPFGVFQSPFVLHASNITLYCRNSTSGIAGSYLVLNPAGYIETLGNILPNSLGSDSLGSATRQFLKAWLKTANISTLPVYANNAAAILGGLVAGDLYRTGADPDPVCAVH